MSDKQRVMIVDDEPSIRMAIELALESSNFDIVTVGSAEAALEQIKGSPPFDLLLIDKNMPGMSGVDLVRKLRESNNPTWCVMITGFASSASAIETLNLGIRGYIEKPFDDIFRVVTQIERLMSMKRTQDKLAQATGRLRALTQDLQKSKQLQVVLALLDLKESQWIGNTLKVRHSDNTLKASTAALTIETLKGTQAPLLITDFAIAQDDFIRFMGRVTAASPRTAVAVIASDKPNTKSIMQLIDAGVKAVIQRPLDEGIFRSRMDAVFLRIREMESEAERDAVA